VATAVDLCGFAALLLINLLSDTVEQIKLNANVISTYYYKTAHSHCKLICMAYDFLGCCSRILEEVWGKVLLDAFKLAESHCELGAYAKLIFAS
jgi:hypothetical protein